MMKIIKRNGDETRLMTLMGKGKYERKSEREKEREKGFNGGSIMTEPSPNSPGSHVSLSLSRCESSGKRNERKECPRIFLQGSRKTGRASATGDEVTKEVGTENERIRSYRGERGRVSRSVRPSLLPLLHVPPFFATPDGD